MIVVYFNDGTELVRMRCSHIRVEIRDPRIQPDDCGLLKLWPIGSAEPITYPLNRVSGFTIGLT